MQERFTISVGEKRVFKLGFLKSVAIVYCGMPTEKTFSISYLESSGNQGYALNLYFSIDSTRIKIKDSEFNVLNVTPEQISLHLSQAYS